MGASRAISVIGYLRAIVDRDEALNNDGEILASFINDRDEQAFASLVKRHGPMVWSVCRGILTNNQDAEDAFQASFLVLVRKAPSIAPRSMVASWLHAVAYQTALQARRNAYRRERREKQVEALPEPVAATIENEPDLRPLLNRELARLRPIYRAVLVLCDMEGKTRKQAAHQLGWPEGTVAGRLARARTLLAKRLRKRGLLLSNAALAALLLENGTASAVPSALVCSAVEATILTASGQTAAAGVISAKAVTLSRGVLNAMFLTKLKIVIATILFVGCLTASGVFTFTGLGAQPSAISKTEPSAQATNNDSEKEDPKSALDRAAAGVDKATADLEAARALLVEKQAAFSAASRKAATDKLVDELKQALGQLGQKVTDKQKTIDALAAIENNVRRTREHVQNDFAGDADANKTQADGLIWGQPVNGLQLGIGLRPGDKGVYRLGDTAEFVVKIRNTSNVPITYVPNFVLFEYIYPRIARDGGPPSGGNFGGPGGIAGGAGGGRGGRGGVRGGGGADVPEIAMPFQLSENQIRGEKKIGAGEVVEIGKQKLILADATNDYRSRPDLLERAHNTPVIFSLPGKHKLSYPELIQVVPRLSTPQVQFEIKAAD